MPPVFHHGGFLTATLRSSCALLVAAAMTGCGTFKAERDKRAETAGLPGENPEMETANALQESGEEAPENFNYCPVQSVRKSAENSDGLAALTSVLNYWDTEASEPELIKAYPAGEENGYSIHQLQRIAIDKGLTAFALTMKAKPLQHLSEQLEHGRPILVTVRFTDGTYFGQPASEIAQISEGAGGAGNAPVIQRDREHYVVVFGQSEKQFLLMDPTFGVLSVDKETFVKYWKEEKYSALLCST